MTLGAQAQGLRVAREFGLNMELWALTGDLKYRVNIEKYFDDRTRASDDLTLNLASHAGFPKEKDSYTGCSLINLIERYAVEDTLGISFSDYKVEDNLYVENNLLHQTKSKSGQPLEYVSCSLRTDGVVKLDTKVLLYIRNGIITKITNLNKSISNK